MLNEEGWVVIEDRSRWVIDFEKINPADESRYISYWSEQKRRTIEGLWNTDWGGYRYMPPTLYFYGNFSIIIDTDHKTKQRKKIKPLVRDLEWEMAYGMLVAKGFSGFADDENYTCNLTALKYKAEGIPSDDIDTSVIKLDGTLKEYKNPLTYLKSVHPEPLGLPLYLNETKNFIVLGSRGGGKSYYFSVGEALHALVTDSAKYYTRESIEFPAKVEICLGSGDTDKSGEFMSKIVSCMNEFAANEDTGVWGKFGEDDYMPNVLYKDMQGQSKAGNKEKPWEHRYKKKVKGRWVDGFGSGSKVYHVSYSSNKKSGAEAGAGGRYVLSLIEEIGLTGSAIEAYNSNVATVTTDGLQFGVQAFLGTSGNIDLIQPAKEMFTNPDDYNMVTYEDQWEHTGKIGFFLPAYITFTDKFRDRHGNIKLEEAKHHFNVRREKAAKASNPKTLRVEKMNYPMVPSDMWVSDRGYYLPYEEAAEREKQLMSGKKYLKKATMVDLAWTSEKDREVKYTIINDKEFFTDFPIRRDLESLAGSMVIYDFPINIAGVLPNDAYTFTHDPYVSDNIDEGESLGVTHVWLKPRYWDKYLINSPLVATYIGKPDGGKKEYYNNLEKLMALYGSPTRGLWYEANRGEYCRGYFAKRGKLDQLCLRPKYEKGQQIYDQKITQYGVVVGSKDAKITMLDDTHDWLLEEVNTISGKQKIISTLPCLFTIKQIMSFNMDDNFDAISSIIINPLSIREESHTLERILKQKAKKNRLKFLSENNKVFKEKTAAQKADIYNKTSTQEWKDNNIQ